MSGCVGWIGSYVFVASLCSVLGCVEVTDDVACVVVHCVFCVLVWCLFWLLVHYMVWFSVLSDFYDCCGTTLLFL